MPIEIVVSFEDGSSDMYYIPNDLLYGYKSFNDEVYLMEPWNWVSKEYEFEVVGSKKITKVIDRFSILVNGTDKAGEFYRFNFGTMFSYIQNKIPEISDELAEKMIVDKQLSLKSSKMLRDLRSEATIEYR